MNKINFKVPTVFCNHSGFIQLFRLWQQIVDYLSTRQTCTIVLDFSNCGFLANNAIAFLGGLKRYVNSTGYANVEFDWRKANPAVFKYVVNAGLYTEVSDEIKLLARTETTIEYREYLQTPDEVSLVDYLSNRWLRPDWIKLSGKLKNAIVGRTVEIFANAFEHSQTKLGAFTCGQDYPRGGYFALTVIDLGIGIPENVRSIMSGLDDSQAIEWAFERGNTTKPGSRGMGLDLLRDFVSINNGELSLYSKCGYALANKAGLKTGLTSFCFDGTALNIKLYHDASLYCFVNELLPGEPLF